METFEIHRPTINSPDLINEVWKPTPIQATFTSTEQQILLTLDWLHTQSV